MKDSMKLTVIVEENVYSLEIPSDFIQENGGFYDKMDADMARGWQMGRDWIAQPDLTQRCQIVADKLLTALENDNQALRNLMAAYLLNRRPDLKSVHLDTQGEMQETELICD